MPTRALNNLRGNGLRVVILKAKYGFKWNVLYNCDSCEASGTARTMVEARSAAKAAKARKVAELAKPVETKTYNKYELYIRNEKITT